MKNLKKIKSKITKVIFGKNCKLVEPVNIYGCKIGNSVFIGPFVEIQKNSKIGDNTRIQSHSFICEKVFIGKKCFISHGTMFVNDLVKSGKYYNAIVSWDNPISIEEYSLIKATRV